MFGWRWLSGLTLSLVSLLAVATGVAFIVSIASLQERPPDVPYVPTPYEVVREMLKVARVGPNDIVYDLGCGDGRIVITAIKEFRAKRGVGVDIDPQRIRESNENAQKAGVTDRVRFLQQDLFQTDIGEATVITLYLLPSVNLRLRPKLFRECRPGTRIVSHDFDMGEWEADRTLRVRGPYREHTVYYWVLPAGVAGTWRWSVSTPQGERRYALRLRQRFQKVSGEVAADGQATPITNAQLVGTHLRFTVIREIEGQKVTMRFSGQVSGDTVRGTVTIQGGPFAGKREWVAKRDPVNLEGTWRWQGGALRIDRRNGAWTATYLQGDRRTLISDFYVWGAGIYLTVENGGTVTAEGVVDGNRLTGTWDGKPWVAIRAKD
ncbi:Ribosomal protein L11 methyltransferase [bacterium HR17]|uniref:Ribosomal protein L11 methyltransferase n=1 Tax=Candidatus Fervidibacter japonicus TaxID=2035412 RepID=A0A2H5XDW0_9BACT|nr:Ribosomal protein L11 methyltransferase [bacterium HR17]